MDTALFSAIQFIFMLTVGLFTLSMYRRLRREAKAEPPDPRAVRLMKLKWLYIAGMVCSLLGAAMFLATWIMAIQ